MDLEPKSGGRRSPAAWLVLALIVAVLLSLAPGTVQAHTGPEVIPFDTAGAAAPSAHSQLPSGLPGAPQAPCCECNNPCQAPATAVIRTTEHKQPTVGIVAHLWPPAVISEHSRAAADPRARNGPPRPGRVVLLNTSRFRN